MPGVPSVSVVMPTYERRDGLLQTLTPLLTDPAATEVVVVVDGSRDGSYELLAELAREHPSLRPVFQENQGDGAARQTGVEAATGDIVLLLDDDVEAAPGLVHGHARAHAGRFDAVVVGYMPPAPPPHGDPEGFSALLYAEAYESRCASYEADPASILRYLWAGNVSLSRDLCRRVGLGNRSFSEHYHRDREFGMRLLRAGAVGVFDRRLRATHHYERGLAAFVRDARSQGAGWTLVHRMHPELVGELPRERFVAGLPRPLCVLVDQCRRPRLGALVARTLTGTARLLGGLGLTRPQLPVARLLRRVEQQRGAIALTHRS
jgi:glycosyltransferase involved in cell wall biosynthesis